MLWSKEKMGEFFEEQEAQYKGSKELGVRFGVALDQAHSAWDKPNIRTLGNRAGAAVRIDTDRPVTTAALLLTLLPRPAKE